jgi:hypothetical protein
MQLQRSHRRKDLRGYRLSADRRREPGRSELGPGLPIKCVRAASALLFLRVSGCCSGKPERYDSLPFPFMERMESYRFLLGTDQRTSSMSARNSVANYHPDSYNVRSRSILDSRSLAGQSQSAIASLP